MPYSERHRLVYIAVPKTGSTSVIEALMELHRRHGGELTLVRERIGPDFRRRHLLGDAEANLPKRAKHLWATHLRQILGERYRASWTFTFVRNPWARVLSQYFFTRVENRLSWIERLRRRSRRRFHELEFPQWLRKRADRAERHGGQRNQIDRLLDEKGGLQVDFVARLESVQEGFAAVCRHTGVEAIAVPHVNRAGPGRRYQDFYDPWSRDLVGDLYRRDIEAFGYEFAE